jgi:hypothetical protein
MVKLRALAARRSAAVIGLNAPAASALLALLLLAATDPLLAPLLLAPFFPVLAAFLLLFFGVMNSVLKIGAGLKVSVASCQP